MAIVESPFFYVKIFFFYLIFFLDLQILKMTLKKSNLVQNSKKYSTYTNLSIMENYWLLNIFQKSVSMNWVSNYAEVSIVNIVLNLLYDCTCKNLSVDVTVNWIFSFLEDLIYCHNNKLLIIPNRSIQWDTY